MGRKLYIRLDVDWEDYEGVSDELMLEDITEYWSDKDGVEMTLLDPSTTIPNWVGWLEKRIPLDDMQKEYIEFAMKEMLKT